MTLKKLKNPESSKHAAIDRCIGLEGHLLRPVKNMEAKVEKQLFEPYSIDVPPRKNIKYSKHRLPFLLYAR